MGFSLISFNSQLLLNIKYKTLCIIQNKKIPPWYNHLLYPNKMERSQSNQKPKLSNLLQETASKITIRLKILMNKLSMSKCPMVVSTLNN